MKNLFPYPTMKGFTRAGIYRMKQFYETYKDNKIVASLVRQISWSHNIGSNQVNRRKRILYKNVYKK